MRKFILFLSFLLVAPIANAAIDVQPGGLSSNSVFTIITNTLASLTRAGIGTNNPQALLEVWGTNYGNGYLFRVSSGNIASGSNAFVITSNATMLAGGSAYFTNATKSANIFINGTNITDLMALYVATGGSTNAIDIINGFGTNTTLYGTFGDLGTNLVLRVEDLATRAKPIFQIIDDNSGSLIFDIDNAGQVATARKVGVGTNPAVWLQVAGDNSGDYLLQIGTTNNPAILRLHTNGSLILNGSYYGLSGQPAYFGGGGGNSDTYLGASGNGDIVFRPGASVEFARMTDAALFGVGTNSPQSTLHVIGNGSTDKLLSVGTTAVDGLFSVDTNGAAAFTSLSVGTLTVSNGVSSLVNTNTGASDKQLAMWVIGGGAPGGLTNAPITTNDLVLAPTATYFSNNMQLRTVGTNLVTGAGQVIDMSQDNTVAVTNVVAGNVIVLLTNIVDRKFFVLRAVADGTARVIAFATGGGTVNWIVTNNITDATNFTIAANKIGTIVGRAWVGQTGGVTNVDVFGNVQP